MLPGIRLQVWKMLHQPQSILLYKMKVNVGLEPLFGKVNRLLSFKRVILGHYGIRYRANTQVDYLVTHSVMNLSSNN